MLHSTQGGYNLKKGGEMRGIFNLSIIFILTLVGQKCFAFEPLSLWGQNRGRTPLSSERLITHSPLERDGRTVSKQMAREAQQPSQEQSAKEWVIEPRLGHDSILAIDRSSTRKNACKCAMLCTGVGILVWYLLQYRPTL